MNHSRIIIETYQSQLGQLELLMCSTSQLGQVEVENGVYTTAGHKVQLKRGTPDFAWLPLGMQVESAVAWLFYISKCNTVIEQLSFAIALGEPNTSVQCGGETGQNLIAIGLENGIRQIHIGTEDEEAMAGRAECGDWMPTRFASPLLKYEMEITTITPWGVSTQIPAMEDGERLYFHYIMAENPYMQSADYPSEADASTWFAVEQSKNQLEKNWRA
ncbi:hypothetical protein GCM10022409_12330 [Hymenobacter glaciei]|uniref:Nudix hydrolase domain-containing protein n=1 Tax=Hymenobacter glaciei TaxID=877209 RepID=A0ABP7TQ10_9BACT